MKVPDIVQEAVIKTIPMKEKCKKAKWLSEETLQTAMKEERVGVGLVTKSCPTLATPWIVAQQAPLSMEFPRQEYWSGLPLSSPAGLPDPGTEVSRLAGTLYHLSYTYDTTSCICQHFMYSIKNPVTVCCISLLPPFASLLCTVMCICYKPHATFFLKSFIFK